MYRLLEGKVGQPCHRSYFKTKEGNTSAAMSSKSTKEILPLLIRSRLLYNRYLSMPVALQFKLVSYTWRTTRVTSLICINFQQQNDLL